MESLYLIYKKIVLTGDGNQKLYEGNRWGVRGLDEEHRILMPETTNDQVNIDRVADMIMADRHVIISDSV